MRASNAPLMLASTPPRLSMLAALRLTAPVSAMILPLWLSRSPMTSSVKPFWLWIAPLALDRLLALSSRPAVWL
ncbi:hypothetical protein D3C78_1145170 [compost metagenome]